jgi:cytochrome c553
MDAQTYRTLALGDAATPRQSGQELAMTEEMQDAITACARCHGAEEKGPASRFVPVLHGQPQPYLLAAMQAYRSGARGSGIMQPIASDLPPDSVRRVVEYYARLTRPAAEVSSARASERENGRRLATDGAPAQQIPPCLPCHDGNALPVYPRLVGQSADYIRGQLRLWKGGFTRNTPTDQIMAPIARRLSEQQMDEVSAFFESAK